MFQREKFHPSHESSREKTGNKFKMHPLVLPAGSSPKKRQQRRMALHAHFSAVDVIVFTLTLIASMAIGIYYSRTGSRQQTNNEYLMAGRSMNSIPVAISVLASFVSSIAILGTPTEVYSFGAQYWLIVLTNFISVPVMVYVFLPVYYNLGLTSSYEVRFESLQEIYNCTVPG